MDTAAVDIASQRVSDILERVKSVFALNGFNGASMQDLAQAAQMSVGNFYRYFPSKDAIITALVKRDMMEIESLFDAIKAAPDPGAMLMHLLRLRIETLPLEDAALWSEVQAASFRSPEIAALMRAMEETVRTYMIRALVRIHGDDSAEALATFAIRANFIMLLVHGFSQRKSCSRDSVSPEQSAAVAELVLSTLHDTIFAPPVPPAV
ncbi:TetR/AcrR family transcriptional regulator [Hoeflea sp. BAL378]|uniref:TetR/AcrR family transcriptional regulator n=1 Tax=Hoeflea sp. BAL378 TaxID=1547437 RepID=UPI00068F2B34|nr:TetR/AcrR family transcriptional regulator [Hoeflea sp. BAL378]